MFDNILLPIDLNHPESWKRALPMAQRLCGTNGTLHILGIVHDLGSAMISTYLPEGFEEHALQQMKQDLDEFRASHLPKEANAAVHVGHGHVPETILSVAHNLGTDVIVMASHPPDDFKTFLVGSNADKVVRHSDIPVLVVR